MSIVIKSQDVAYDTLNIKVTKNIMSGELIYSIQKDDVAIISDKLINGFVYKFEFFNYTDLLNILTPDQKTDWNFNITFLKNSIDILKVSVPLDRKSTLIRIPIDATHFKYSLKNTIDTSVYTTVSLDNIIQSVLQP